MKKFIYTLLSLAILLFNSCSNSDDLVIDQKNNVTTIKLSIDKESNSRYKTIDTYYYAEAYIDADYSTPANVFIDEDSNPTNKITSVTGEFSMILDSSKDYHFLFFAADDEDCYDTSNLKSVTLKDGDTPAEAWYSTFETKGRTDIIYCQLQRAVAKLSLYETGNIPENSKLTLSFKQPTTFNVATGKTVAMTSAASERIEEINLINAIDGTTTPFELWDEDIFILAPYSDTADLINITFKMSNLSDGTLIDKEFEESNVPIQANRVTNISGHFSSLSQNQLVVNYLPAWVTNQIDYNF